MCPLENAIKRRCFCQFFHASTFCRLSLKPLCLKVSNEGESFACSGARDWCSTPCELVHPDHDGSAENAAQHQNCESFLRVCSRNRASSFKVQVNHTKWNNLQQINYSQATHKGGKYPARDLSGFNFRVTCAALQGFEEGSISMILHLINWDFMWHINKSCPAVHLREQRTKGARGKFGQMTLSVSAKKTRESTDHIARARRYGRTESSCWPGTKQFFMSKENSFNVIQRFNWIFVRTALWPSKTVLEKMGPQKVSFSSMQSLLWQVSRGHCWKWLVTGATRLPPDGPRCITLQIRSGFTNQLEMFSVTCQSHSWLVSSPAVKNLVHTSADSDTDTCNVGWQVTQQKQNLLSSKFYDWNVPAGCVLFCLNVKLNSAIQQIPSAGRTPSCMCRGASHSTSAIAHYPLTNFVWGSTNLRASPEWPISAEPVILWKLETQTRSAGLVRLGRFPFVRHIWLEQKMSTFTLCQSWF